MANNILVDWLNKKFSNVQGNVLKKGATNTTNITNPNPPEMNIQSVRNPTQSKLDNLNAQTLPTEIANNPSFQKLKQNIIKDTYRDEPSRFIGLQEPYHPKTDLAGNLIDKNGNLLNTATKGKSWEVEQNKPILNIPTQSSKVSDYNSKQEKIYRDNEQAIKDFHYDVRKNGGMMTREQISQLYPEFAGKEDVALMLQADLLPLVQNNEFADTKKLSELYPELLPEQKKVDAEELAKKQKNRGDLLKTLSERADRLLGTRNTLSEEGAKLLEDASQIEGLIKYIRDNYRLPGEPTDMDILNYASKNMPEVKALVEEMGSLNLTDLDRATISPGSGNPLVNKKAITQLFLNDVSNAWQKHVIEPMNLGIESGEWGTRLNNIGINRGSADTLLDLAKIPANMAGNAIEGTNKVYTAKTRIERGQDRSLNELAKDTINLGGGALDIGFNTAWALPTAIFEAVNTTEMGKDITDNTLGLFQEGIVNILDGSFAEDIGLNKDTYLSAWYNSLDEETKADLVNELTVAVMHEGGKVAKEGKLEFDVAVDAISNAFERGKGGALFQAWVEKGMADEGGALTKGARSRIIKEGYSEFKDALKENFRMYDTVLKNRRGDITANWDTLPDNRTFKEKSGRRAYEKGQQTREVVDNVKDFGNNVADTVKEKVQDVNVGDMVKTASEKVGEGVKYTSDLLDKGKNAVTQGKNKVTNAVKENVVEPFKKGYEGVKETVNENIVEPYNKGRGKTNEFNKKTVNQGQQLQESNSTSEINNKVNGDNYTQKNTNSKKLNKVQLKLLQNNNKMNPKSIDTFKEWYGEDYGQYMYDRGFTKSADGGNLKEMEDYKNSLLSQKRATLNKIEGTYQDISLSDMAEHLVEKATTVRNRKLLKEAQELQNKHNETGLTMPEADRLRTLFQQNVKMGFHQDIPADARERAKNEYMAVKEFLDDVGRKNGFDDLDYINREIQKTQHIIKGVESKLNRESANNAYTLTDYILMAEAFTNPQTAAVFTAKQILKNPKVRSAGLNIAVGGRENAKNRVTASSRERINENVESIAGAKRKQKEMGLSEAPALPNGIKLSKVTEIDKRKPTDTTSPTENTPTEKVEETAPKKKSKSKPKNKVTSKKSEVTEYVNETPQNERGQMEEIEAEENLRSNETPQRDIVEETKSEPKVENKSEGNYNSISSALKDYAGKELYDHKYKIKIGDNDQAIYAENIDGPRGTRLHRQNLVSLQEFNDLLKHQEEYKAEYEEAMQKDKEQAKQEEEKQKEEERRNKPITDFINTIDNKSLRTKAENDLKEMTRWKLDDGRIVNWSKAEYINYLVNDLGFTPKEFPTGKTYPNGEPKVDYMIVNEKNVGYKSNKIENAYARSLLEKHEEEISAEDEAVIDELFTPKTTTEITGEKNVVTAKSVDKKENTNIIGKNNSLTTKNTTNGGKDLGTAESGLNQGVGGASESRDLQRTDGLSGTERDNSGGISGDLHKEQGNNDLIVDGKSAGPAVGQGQRKLLTRGEARAINQSSKDILEKHKFSTNPKDYTAEEIETLRQYEGAGGLTNKGEDTKGVLDQFYTPQTAIDAVWHLVDKYKNGKDTYTVLEPTVGTGRFIRDRANEQYEGHEIDKTPGTIAQILHPEAKISVGDFEDQFMDFTGRRPQEYQGGKKDIVVGNPPYSQRITPQQKNGLEPKIKRSEEFFIKKGIDVLDDGGVLAMVVPSTFLSNPMTYAKEQIFDNATLVDAYRLPEGVFPYTQVGTDIVVFKKSKSLFKRENNLSDNKRFEQHPEKVLGEVKERINRFGKLEKYVDGGGHPLDKLNAIYEDAKTVPETKKEQAENYSPVETKEETPIKQKTTTEITGEKNKVTAKTTANKKPTTKKGVKVENQTLIRGDKTDIGDSVFGKGELDNKLLEYSKKTDINGYVEGPVGELIENDPKNLNYYKGHAVINDLYFAGDIYEKLEQLEKDYNLTEKGTITPEQYKKQKEGLQAVMPEPYTIENHPFLSPLDQNVMEFETNEIGNVYDSTAHDYVDKKLPIKDVFLERFRKNVSSSTVNKNLAREYINGEAMRSTSGGYGLSDEEKAAKARHEKSVVMEQVNEIFNDWLWNKLDKDVQQKILDKFNRENRSYVVPKYENMALATRGISKTFNGKPFKPQPGQVEGINFLLSKGAGIVAHGVGHGKTIEGVIATREAQLRGWNKRPLIVAPGPTLYAQWVRTIKELYPEWEIVNLGGLTKADIKRLKDELGDDPRDWVKDGQVAILSMQGFGDHIEFKPGTQRELEAKLHDVMETKDLNVRQSESLDKKITQMLAPGKGASSDKYTYSEKGDFLRTMYSYLVASEKSDFIDYFTEHTKEEYPELSDEVIKADAEAMWNEKPVFLEDLGIDHITVDEMHNFKNVFTSAKMQEDEYGKKDVNRYGQIIKGTSSARGQKMYLATQYILDRNNNRNVFGLTATPFNNQPIEMYNMLSFVGRNELEKMGLTNINDFFSRFAEFREGLAPKASGTELEYKFIMKDFANARDLQRTITQFINYKGDSEDLIKPEKKLKVPVLKMSELQKQRQSELEYMALAKENQGDVLKATNGMISNLVSPFIVAGTRAPTGWKDFLDNSPKLKYFADVLKELRAEGRQDGMFIYMPVGQEFHELYAEALSEYAGVPREKIGIIDSKTSAKKDEIAEKFRSGEVNVLIGGKNTAEGIDLQNNGYITAITSVGWNPTERVQVDGRVWRQGNYNNEVLSVVPLIENSADVIFMGKADQKGSRINNALEQMLFGGEGDLSADEMMMSLMTEPEKKARTQINIQSQEIDKEIYGLNSQKDRLQELKRRINDAQKDPEEIQKQIDNEKQAGRTWRLPSLKDELKTATKAKEWIDAYKENNGELPSIEDIDNQTLEIEKQVDELRATQSELKNNEDILNTLIEEIKQKQADDAKGVKSYQDYIDDIKSDFKNAKRFGSKEELREYLDNKKNNVLANDKNKITSGKTMASRASRPSIRMNVDDWEKKNVTDTPKNKVTSGKNYNIPQENKTKIGQAITKIRNNAENGGVKVARYTKNGPLENALNTIYNINSIKRKIRGQDHYNNVLNGKEEGLLSIAEILDGGYKDENISYKRFYDPLDEKHPTIIFWKGDNIDSATKTWALHLNKNDNTNPSIDKFRDRRGRLEVTPLRKRKRGKKK